MAAAAGPGGLGNEKAFGIFGDTLEVGDPAHLLIVDRDPVAAPDPAATRVLAAYRHGDPVGIESELPFV
jgi:hypothetical protein